MGNLAHSADMRTSGIETTVPGMIERALTATLTPLSVSINDLAIRIYVCMRGHVATHEVTALKTVIAELRKDVDQLKFTDMSMIFGTMEIPDMPCDSNVPPATARDEVQVHELAAAESEAETDEK
ncbi:uncharacterized protein LOC125829340 [Solanum verrucosum]|uniref:uncharacterized protein LOC125829340 n=1 Tax=Solanum verrucosum TaxID=315347 RepID=UPI0020D1B722|nr:uncharacterized protein LOC125829340 [Solanum verrucosum]